MTYFGMKDRFLDGDAQQAQQETLSFDSVCVPSNDDDIDGIVRYLGWHMYKAGMSSNVLHYLYVLANKATGK